MSKPYVPTRRFARPAKALVVFEQRNGLWTIIEVHTVGSPRRLVYVDQRRRTVETCIKRALRQEQDLIVWGTIAVPRSPIAAEDLPLLACEVGA